MQSAGRVSLWGVDYGLNVRHVDDLHQWMEAMDADDAEGCDPSGSRTTDTAAHAANDGG